jgi:hypothetical protein
MRALDDPRPDPSVCAATLRAATRLGRAGLLAQTASWSARRGCSGREFRGERGLAMALAGEWAVAEAIAAEPGPRAASGVVLDAVVATRSGDEAALAAAQADPAAPPDLSGRVESILSAPDRATLAPEGGPP